MSNKKWSALALAFATSVTLMGAAPESKVPPTAVATGVVQIDGKPVSGAMINLTLWPNVRVLEAVPVDEYAPVQQIGTFTTDANGRFVLTADPALFTKDYQEYTGEGYVANFEVRIIAGTRELASWGWPMKLEAKRTAANLMFDLGSKPVARDLGVDTSLRVGPEPAAAVNDIAAIAGDQMPQCYPPQKSSTYWDHIHELYAGFRNNDSSVEGISWQAFTSSHTLGWAIMATGTGGYPWKAGGTAGHGLTVGGEQRFPGRYRQYTYNQVQMRQWVMYCTYAPNWRYEARYEKTIDLGHSTSVAPVVDYPYGNYTRTQGWEITTTTATNYYYSAGLEFIIGLHSQSGWSSTQKQTYIVKTAHAKHRWSNSGGPYSSAGQSWRYTP